jgi:hypothetical protein
MQSAFFAKWRGPQQPAFPWHAAVLVVLITVIAGCGGTPAEPSGTVTGKVTLNGKPFELGVVTLVKPDGVPAGWAELSSTGEFRLPAPVPVGQYRVAIGPPDEDAPAGGPAPRLDAALKAIPPKYRNEATSGLTATVKEGENTFTFEMQ